MNIRNVLIALLMIAGIAFLAVTANAGIEVLGIEVLGIEVLGIEVLGIEVLGIEVLGIEVLDSGGMSVAMRVPEAPPGSYAEAVMTANGTAQLVDAAPICPMTGTVQVHFPASIPGSYIQFRGPDGTVLSGSDYVGQLEYD